MSLAWRKRLFGQSAAEDEGNSFEKEGVQTNTLEDDMLWHSGEMVIEVVGHVASAKGVTIEEAAKSLNRIYEDGKVRFIDPSPPQSFLSYLTSFYSIWYWFVVCFVFLVFASIYLLPQSYPFIYFRYAAGAIFILFLPGYVLIEALYPKAVELEKLERFALDIGLSLAIVPLTGLLLNYTPWGIRLDPIFSSLCGIVLVFGIVGVWRKYSYLKIEHSKR